MCVCVFWPLSFSPILYFVLNCFFFAIWNLSSSSTSYRLLLSVSICMRKIPSHSSSSSSYCCCFCSPLFYLFIDDWHRHKTMHTLSLLSSIFFYCFGIYFATFVWIPSVHIYTCVRCSVLYILCRKKRWRMTRIERTNTNKQKQFVIVSISFVSFLPKSVKDFDCNSVCLSK